jgi:outer membrane lipoprotein SlyB
MDKSASSPRRLHPLIATAAGGIIVASLAATAAVTGLIPIASSSGLSGNATQSAQGTGTSSPAVVDSAAPANGNWGSNAQTSAAQPTQQTPQAGLNPPSGAPADPSRAQPTQAAQGPYAPRAAQSAATQYAQQTPQSRAPQYGQPSYAQPQTQSATCSTCGTVESIASVQHQGRGTGIGAVGGAVAGGLLGNQFGRGTGRTAMTVLGAVGGGFAGNAVEKHLRSTTDYQVRVRMDNGHTRYFSYRSAPPFSQGERVHIEHGALAAG